MAMTGRLDLASGSRPDKVIVASDSRAVSDRWWKNLSDKTPEKSTSVRQERKKMPTFITAALGQRGQPTDGQVKETFEWPRLRSVQ
jgi:hypothetical protein